MSKLFKLKIALPVGVRDPLDTSHGGTLRCMIDYRIPTMFTGILLYVSRKVVVLRGHVCAAAFKLHCRKLFVQNLTLNNTRNHSYTYAAHFSRLDLACIPETSVVPFR